MNKIKVRFRAGWYYVFVDTKLQFSTKSMPEVVGWLEENFSPPIEVRWFVGKPVKIE